MAGQPGFWDVEDRLRQLSARGDPLEKLSATIDFELFRSDLKAAVGPRDVSKGGRPSFDVVLKFRMLVLLAHHGLSLDQTEYLVRDRLSWMRFCRNRPVRAAFPVSIRRGPRVRRLDVPRRAATSSRAGVRVAASA